MGNCVCVKPQPALIHRFIKTNSPGIDDLEQINYCLLEKKSARAPLLQIKRNSLYVRRKLTLEEDFMDERLNP
jgi:hypothetical protein